MKLNLTKDWYERRIEKEEDIMSTDKEHRGKALHKAPLSERIRPNSEAAPWIIDEIKTMEKEIERLKADIKQIHKDYGCEVQDPSGTIWDHAAYLQNQIAEKDTEINRLLSIVHKYKIGGLRR